MLLESVPSCLLSSFRDFSVIFSEITSATLFLSWDPKSSFQKLLCQGKDKRLKLFKTLLPFDKWGLCPLCMSVSKPGDIADQQNKKIGFTSVQEHTSDTRSLLSLGMHALGEGSCHVRNPATLRWPFMKREKYKPAPEIPAIPVLDQIKRVQKSSRMLEKNQGLRHLDLVERSQALLAVWTNPAGDEDIVEH